MHDKETAISNLIGLLNEIENNKEDIFDSALIIFERILPLNHWAAWELMMFYKLGKKAMEDFERARLRKGDVNDYKRKMYGHALLVASYEKRHGKFCFHCQYCKEHRLLCKKMTLN